MNEEETKKLWREMYRLAEAISKVEEELAQVKRAEEDLKAAETALYTELKDVEIEMAELGVRNNTTGTR